MVDDSRRLSGRAVSAWPFPIAFGLLHNLAVICYFAGRLFRGGVLLIFFVFV
jgi:hypothetical protein